MKARPSFFVDPLVISLLLVGPLAIILPAIVIAAAIFTRATARTRKLLPWCCSDWSCGLNPISFDGALGGDGKLRCPLDCRGMTFTGLLFGDLLLGLEFRRLLDSSIDGGPLAGPSNCFGCHDVFSLVIRDLCFGLSSTGSVFNCFFDMCSMTVASSSTVAVSSCNFRSRSSSAWRP